MITRWQSWESWRRWWQRSRDLQRQRRWLSVSNWRLDEESEKSFMARFRRRWASWARRRVTHCERWRRSRPASVSLSRECSQRWQCWWTPGHKLFSVRARDGQIFPKLTLNLKFTCQVKKLADMGGVTEDLGVISSKVRDAKQYQNRWIFGKVQNIDEGPDSRGNNIVLVVSTNWVTYWKGSLLKMLNYLKKALLRVPFCELVLFWAPGEVTNYNKVWWACYQLKSGEWANPLERRETS